MAPAGTDLRGWPLANDWTNSILGSSYSVSLILRSQQGIGSTGRLIILRLHTSTYNFFAAAKVTEPPNCTSKQPAIISARAMSSATIQNGVISKPTAPKRDVQWADVSYPAHAPFLPVFFNFASLDCNANSTRVGYSWPCVFLRRHRPRPPRVCMANALE